MRSMREAHQELKSKLEASKKELKASQDTLAVVVLEKQQLVRDNADLKSVSEELLAMIEGGGG